MKKILSIIVICAVFIIPARGQAATYQIHINGNEINFPVLPVIMNSTIYAPVRELSDAFGANVSWHANIGAVSINVHNDEWLFFPEQQGVYRNGRLVSGDAKAINSNGKVMVPVRFLSELLGFDVSWEGSTKTAYLTTSGTACIVIDPAIMGKSQATAEQMAAFLLENNSNPKIPCTALELATMYIEEGQAEGVRGDIAFAQSIHETGYFDFSGTVQPEQYNYAGLGSTASGIVGLSFNSPREGIRAQIQHLKAYASTSDLNQDCVDPRFELVSRGSAIHVEQLAQALNPAGTGWAYPGYNRYKYSTVTEAYAARQTYGQLILDLIDKIIN